MIGIYKVTSPSSKVYIGQSWDIEKRFSSYRRQACKSQTYLYNSIKKYGAKAHIFEIVHELPSDISKEILDIYEIFYIAQYKECNIPLINLREGGGSGGKGQKMSPENKELLRLRMLGNKHSLGNKNALGKKWTSEQKKAKGDSQRGDNNPKRRAMLKRQGLL